MKSNASIFMLSQLTYRSAEKSVPPHAVTIALEAKIDALVSLMTLEEKIGQMTQVRHFDDIKPKDIKNKHIGSVIHTQGGKPGTLCQKMAKAF